MKKGLFSLLLFVISQPISAVGVPDYRRVLTEAYVNGKFAYAEILCRNAIQETRSDSIIFDATNKRAEIFRITGSEYRSEAILKGNIAALVKSGKYPILLAEAYDQLGELKYYISDTELAGLYFRKSLALKAKHLKSNDARLAFSISNIGRYFNYTQSLDSAIYYTRKAYTIIKHQPVNIEQILPELIYCEYAYALKGKPKLEFDESYEKIARPVYFEALKFNQSKYGAPNYYQAYILHYLGNTYTDQVRHTEQKKDATLQSVQQRFYMKATYYYNRAVAIFKQILPLNNPKLSMTYYVMGLVNDYNLESPAKSLYYYNLSLQEILPKADYIIRDTESSIGRVYNKHHVLSLLSYKIKSAGRLYKNGYENYGDSVLISTEIIYAWWKGMLNHYTHNNVSDITTYYYRVPYEDALTVCYNRLTVNNSKFYLTKALHFIESSKYASFRKNLRTFSLEEIQHTILDNQAILLFYDGKEFSYQLLVTKRKIVLARNAVSGNINEDLDGVFDIAKYTTAKVYKDKAYKIYRNFLSIPLEENIRSIAIIPGAEYTNLIPFEALPFNQDGDSFKELNYCLNRYTINYYLSLNARLAQSQRDGYERNKFIAIASNISQYSELPFSSQLVSKLNAEYGGDSWESSKGGKSGPLNFDDYAVLHVAGHSVKASNPDSSYLLLNEKRMFLPQIHQLNLNCNLICLEACETGLGKSIRENGGAISFVRAFTYAGAGAVTAALWKIDDKESAAIYDKFYNYLEIENKSDALTFAKRDYLKANSDQLAHPYYWAGIVLYGNPDKIDLPKRTKTSYYVAASILLIFISLAYYKYK